MESVILEKKREIKYKDYHFASLFVSVFLICLTPFVSPYLVFVPFIIQTIRLMSCKPEVFLVDLSCLLVFSNLFREPAGKTLYAVLIIGACAWFFVTKRFKVSTSLLFGLILFAYLITRSITNFISAVPAMSGVLIIYIVSVFVNRQNAILASKIYTVSVLFASIFGFIFKDNSALLRYTKARAAANASKDAFRFKGLFQDPNYYASCIIIAIALIIILYIIKEIDITSFIVGFVGLTAFGFLTYSKAFLIVYIVTCFFYMAISVKRKRFILLVLFILLFIILMFSFASDNIEFFAIMKERFGESDDLNGITSGRSESWENYLDYILSDVKVLMLGDTLGAPLINRLGTHNIIIELLYYTGIIGLLLYILFFWSVIHDVINNNSNIIKRSGGVMKYIIIAAFIITYMSLQAVFFSTMYAQWVRVAAGVLLSYNEPKIQTDNQVDLYNKKDKRVFLNNEA